MTEPPLAPGGVTSIEHVWIAMPDGVRLAARIWLPRETGPGGVPAILEYIPYRKADMVRARDERNHPWFARHGYACLRVDMRGSGDSEGLMQDMYTQAEIDDARHVIAWIAAQDWCNGRVGMFGTSWGGTASLQASIDCPSELKAVMAVCATHDRYEDDIHHMGGCLLTDSIEWGATLPAILALPPTPAIGADWFERWMARLEHLANPVEAWVREEARGSYWRHGSIKGQIGRVGCPVLAVGGWSDRYSNSVMSLVDAASAQLWGIVGPWGHHYPDHGHPGPAIGFQQVALEWWDHWLRSDAGAEPPWPKMRVWLREFDPPNDVLDSRNGGWVESGPPAAETVETTLTLASGQRLAEGTPEADGDWDIPADLQHGLASGDTGYFGRYGGLPLEQNEDDARALAFDGEPLATDLVLYGAAEVELTLETEDKTSQICVRLCDIAPDGSSSRVSYAIRNLALDDALDAPKAPHGRGQRRVRLCLHSAAYRFKAGHRIRLAIASSYWPLVWTPPRIGRVRLRAGTLRLRVPLADLSELSAPFPSPLGTPTPTDTDILSAPLLIRRRERRPDGTLCVAWQQPRGATLYPSIETIFSTESSAEHTLNPDDAASSRTVFRHAMDVSRPDGTAHVEVQTTASSTADAYSIDTDLKVRWAGETVGHRSWRVSVPRRFS